MIYALLSRRSIFKWDSCLIIVCHIFSPSYFYFFIFIFQKKSIQLETHVLLYKTARCFGFPSITFQKSALFVSWRQVCQVIRLQSYRVTGYTNFNAMNDNGIQCNTTLQIEIRCKTEVTRRISCINFLAFGNFTSEWDPPSTRRVQERISLSDHSFRELLWTIHRDPCDSPPVFRELHERKLGNAANTHEPTHPCPTLSPGVSVRSLPRC